MTASLGTKAPPSGVVYLVHFTQPYRHARHYTGWTADLDSRLVRAPSRTRRPTPTGHHPGRDRLDARQNLGGHP